MSVIASDRRHRLRVVLTSLAVGLSLVLTATASSCQKKTDNSVAYWRSQSPTLQGKTKLRIGVQADEPLMGYRDPQTGTYEGFDIDIAKMIVGDLGYANYEWVALKTPERQSALQEGRADLVVASFSMTPERSEVVGFAGPYLAVRQQVMFPVALDAMIKNESDLRTRRVCAASSSTSEQRLREREIIPVVRLTNRECVEAMRNGEVDVVSTDQTILAGFKEQYKGEFIIRDMGWDVSELLGVGVPKNDPWLAGLVKDILLESYKAGTQSRWQVAYNKFLAPALEARFQPIPDVPVGVPDLIDVSDRTSPRALAAVSGAPALLARRPRRTGRGRGRP